MHDFPSGHNLSEVNNSTHLYNGDGNKNFQKMLLIFKLSTMSYSYVPKQSFVMPDKYKFFRSQTLLLRR